MIKKADKKNINNISTLIYDAIHDIANTLTGEKEEKKILETLDLYEDLFFLKTLYPLYLLLNHSVLNMYRALKV